MRFLSFNREQALAKLTWGLTDSNVKSTMAFVIQSALIN